VYEDQPDGDGPLMAQVSPQTQDVHAGQRREFPFGKSRRHGQRPAVVYDQDFRRALEFGERQVKPSQQQLDRLPVVEHGKQDDGAALGFGSGHSQRVS
jgi:hypothetical protein